MAKFEAYEEKLISLAYEMFKEAYDDAIKVGLDKVDEVPELNGCAKGLYICYGKNLFLEGLKKLGKEIEADVIATAKQYGAEIIIIEKQRRK